MLFVVSTANLSMSTLSFVYVMVDGSMFHVELFRFICDGCIVMEALAVSLLSPLNLVSALKHPLILFPVLQLSHEKDVCRELSAALPVRFSFIF